MSIHYHLALHSGREINLLQQQQTPCNIPIQILYQSVRHFCSAQQIDFSSTLREERRLRVFGNKLLIKIFASKRYEVKGSGEDYIMRNFMICTVFHKILG